MKLRFIGETDRASGIIHGQIYDCKSVRSDPTRNLLGTGMVQIGLHGVIPYTPLGFAKYWENPELADLRAKLEAAIGGAK